MKKGFDRGSAFLLKKANFTVLYVNCLMNFVIKKDFQRMGTPIGRMHLEAYLRTKYLQCIKMLFMSLTVRAKETGCADYNLTKQIDEERGHYATLFFIEMLGALEKLCLRATKNLICHWVQEQSIFWGCKGFFPKILQTCLKSCCGLSPTNFL